MRAHMAQLAVKLESVKSISLNVQIRAIYKQNKTKHKKRNGTKKRNWFLDQSLVDFFCLLRTWIYIATIMGFHCRYPKQLSAKPS